MNYLFLAFQEVFDLFDSNGGGTIDADELDTALRSVDICLTQSEICDVLVLMDKDGKTSHSCYVSWIQVIRPATHIMSHGYR